MCTFVGNMKHLVYILLGLMLVGVFSCRRSPGGTEARLVAIDSLITAKPDSALALLADINADSLPADLRAYHDVLTTQALYKAYIPATTDTLIARAWSYYRDHGPYDRRIRAMLYSGTTAEELGRPDSAMRWYKRTELESRPDDHYHRGYALMSMGLIYQRSFETKQAINKYLSALSCMDSSQIKRWAYCTQQLAQLYLLSNSDSARIFIDQISQYVQETGDSIYMLANWSNKSMMWFYNEQYDSARNAALAAITSFDERAPYTCWYQLVISYSKLNKPDSARFYFSRIPPAATIKDSIYYYEMLHVLSRHEGKWKDALQYKKISDNISDEVLTDEAGNSLLDAEYKALEEFNLASQDQSIPWWPFGIIILILIPFIVWIRFNRQIRQAEKHAEEQITWLTTQFTEAQFKIEDLENEKHSLLQRVSEVQSELHQTHKEIYRLKTIQEDADILKVVNAQFKQAFHNCFQRLGDIAANYYEHGENGSMFIKQFKTEFESCWKSQDFWMAMENHINASRCEAMRRLKDSHTDLTVSDLRLVMLTILHFEPMAILICMNYKKIDVVYSMRNKLKKKLKCGAISLEEYLETFTKPPRNTQE